MNSRWRGKKKKKVSDSHGSCRFQHKLLRLLSAPKLGADTSADILSEAIHLNSYRFLSGLPLQLNLPINQFAPDDTSSPCKAWSTLGSPLQWPHQRRGAGDGQQVYLLTGAYKYFFVWRMILPPTRGCYSASSHHLPNAPKLLKRDGKEPFLATSHRFHAINRKLSDNDSSIKMFHQGCRIIFAHFWGNNRVRHKKMKWKLLPYWTRAHTFTLDWYNLVYFTYP